MKLVKNRWLRAAAFVLLLLLSLTTVSRSAYAQEIIYGESVDSGKTVENDIILNGDNVALDGTVDGDVLAIGRHITIDGKVTGSLVAIGETVTISGEIDGSAYVLALSLDLAPTAQIAHNVYFLGGSLLVEEKANIGWDLVAVSLGANMRGSVGRDSRLIVGLVEIARLVLDRVNQATTGKSLDETGLFSAPNPTASGMESVGGAMFRVLGQDEANDGAEEELTAGQLTWLWDLARSFVSYLVVGLLAIWLLAKPLDRWAERLRVHPLVAAGAGIVVWIVGFVGFALLLVLFIGVGVALFSLTLVDLAIMFWALAIPGLLFAFAIFLLFVSYLSKIVVAYLVGRLILNRFLPRALSYRIWPLLLGLFLLVLIGAIPFVGWAVSLIVTFLGLGAVWLAFNDGRKLDSLPAATAEAVAIEA